jgi:TolB-like protein
MSEVFVSYKRENLAAVGRLVEALRAEGIGVWWDQDIAPNAAWEATIENALAAAKLVIVAWSPASVGSENVKAEARWARAQGRLLQVFVETCEPPLFFGERQGVDLKHWSGEGSETGFRTVLEAVRKGLSEPSSPSPDDGAASEVFTGAAGPPPLPSKPSIAVLPFTNLSGDAEQDYFADGMVEEITTALSRIRSIFVIASGSSLSFKGKDLSPQEAARELGVRYVLEGSVRKAANRVRIAVKLIDAGDGAQIWAERFEDTLDDVFALQDKVALGVAGKIEPTVQMAEVRRASARPTESLGSYDLYLRAYPLLRVFAKAETFEALNLLNRAIALDPDYAVALAEVALCRLMIDLYGWSDDPEDNRRQAVELAHRALKAASDDAYVLSVGAGIVAYIERDMPAAVALVDRAIALNPGSSFAWQNSGSVRVLAGEADLAIEHLEMSMRLDPLGPDRTMKMILMSWARFQQGRFGESVALSKEVVQQSDNPGPYAMLAANYGHMGQTVAGREALARYRTLTPRPLADFGYSISHDPAHLRLFLDGIALIEGKTPSDSAPGG